MRDRIYIEDLTVSCIIGIRPEERVHKQSVVVNITLETDLRTAAQSDVLTDTVDYSSLKNDIVEMMERSQFFLIEKLATEIAALCLACEKVAAARVRVDKPGALTFAKSVGVDIYRLRGDVGSGAMDP